MRRAVWQAARAAPGPRDGEGADYTAVAGSRPESELRSREGCAAEPAVPLAVAAGTPESTGGPAS